MISCFGAINFDEVHSAIALQKNPRPLLISEYYSTVGKTARNLLKSIPQFSKNR